MELLQLKYFCESAESQNFSHTAKKYFVPVSSVSQSIKRLEKELSVELFEHLGNKIILAEEGRRFYEKVSQALILLEEAQNAVKNTEDMHGEISLLILCNRRLVSEAIENFRKAYPYVNFVLQYTDDTSPCDIIISDKHPDGYYEKDVLVKEDMLLAMNANHPLAAKKDFSVCELSEEKFISMPKGRSIHSFTEEICNRAGFTPDIAIKTEDPYYVRKYVEMGMGIAFFPAISWKGLFSDNVVLKRIENYKRTTYIYLPKNRKQKSVTTAFLEYLKSVQ